MNYRCKECGKCCLETEMILSQQDIERILRFFPNIVSKRNFTFINDDKQFQLKNLEGHCIFFEPVQKLCKIYEYRPQGCRYYPLTYDLDRNMCIFDKDCPRKNDFYEDQDKLKKACKDLRSYLKNELAISVK